MKYRLWVGCHVSIKSRLTLTQLGEQLSKEIFGSAGFWESRAHHETPLIVLNHKLFGLHIAIDGAVGEYSLRMRPNYWKIDGSSIVDPDATVADISPYMAEVLSKIDGIDLAEPVGL